MRETQFSTRSLFVGISLIAMGIALPGLTACIILMLASLFIGALMITTIQETWSSTERSERRLVVPYGIVLLCSISSFVFACYFAFLALAAFGKR